MVTAREEYICTVCEERYDTRAEAENCLCSPFHEVRVTELFLCSKCGLRFYDPHSAQSHEMLCVCGE